MAVPANTLESIMAPASLTPAQALAEAEGLRELLIQESPATEARTFHSSDLHRIFVEKGFYHLLAPRMFGGYEFTLPDFMRVMRELARGDMATAWCLTLASGHNLQAASWFDEARQREMFSGGYFAAPMTAAPGGTLSRDGDGWLLSGGSGYCSGVPYSTHFIGHAMHADGPGPMSTFVIPREDFEIQDDWGRTLGLRGSGSHSIRYNNIRLSEDQVLERKMQIDMNVDDGTPGLRLHGNPIFGGRALGFFSTELANLMVGALKGALDEYETLMATKRTARPPVVARSENTHYQRWFGLAATRVDAAEAIADRAAEMFMDVCERAAAGGEPFSHQDDVRINMLAREALVAAWEVMQDSLFLSVGTSAVTQGSRFERIWRDMSMGWGHLNTVLRDWMAVDYAQGHFGHRD